jgi:histidinol phosphatase-like enzyme (inositol monophosphatase family)
MSHERELRVAREAVAAAGAITLEHFGRGVAVERKADQSPVTIADRRSEECIRAALEAAFPADGLLGEEFGERSGSSGRRWIVDPIDGTQSFIRGVPLYGILVGLEEEGRAVVGVMGFPALDLTYWAAHGGGAFRNGERIRVSTVASLADATVVSSDVKPQVFGDRYPRFERLLRTAACYRGWGDCYGYALVAGGQADVMVDAILSPWDAAAVLPIVEEAGGRFVDWSGAPDIFGGSGIGTSAALLDEVLAILRDEPAR